MFNIKQRYIDPITLKVSYCQFALTLDERRSEYSSSIAMEPVLIAYTTSKDGKNATYLNPDQCLIDLIDTKRTLFSKNQTYLIAPYNGGKQLNIFDSKHLSAKIGDPLVVMNNIDGDIIDYALVSDISKNQITLNIELKNSYFMGAIVQNLANKWNKYPLKRGIIGIKAQLLSPSSLNFSLKSEKELIKLMVHMPPNLGSILYYDVYVRDCEFNFIEPHWIPDIFDSSIKTPYADIITYMGGIMAGGGKLLSNKDYYIALIAKDGLGRFDVNESLPIINSILVK